VRTKGPGLDCGPPRRDYFDAVGSLTKKMIRKCLLNAILSICSPTGWAVPHPRYTFLAQNANHTESRHIIDLYSKNLGLHARCPSMQNPDVPIHGVKLSSQRMIEAGSIIDCRDRLSGQIAHNSTGHLYAQYARLCSCCRDFRSPGHRLSCPSGYTLNTNHVKKVLRPKVETNSLRLAFIPEYHQAFYSFHYPCQR